MKKPFFLFLFIFFLTFSPPVQSDSRVDAQEIINKAKEASAGIKTVRVIGRSITGSINTTYSQGAMDYLKGNFFLIENTDSMVIRSIYLKDNSTYIYDGIFANWVKFAEPVDFSGKIFKKDMWFSIFPTKADELGLEVKLLGEQMLEGQACYVLHSRVVDIARAKFYVSKFLEDFFSKSLISMLRSDERILQDFLTTYVKNLKTTLWISKDSFFVVKLLNSYDQMPGEGEALLIEDESVFYDFNKPLEIEIPEDAQSAKVVKSADLGPIF